MFLDKYGLQISETFNQHVYHVCSGPLWFPDLMIRKRNIFPPGISGERILPQLLKGLRVNRTQIRGICHIILWAVGWLLWLARNLGLHLWHMEVPRLGVKSELHLLAYTTATAVQDPSLVFDFHHSSGQCQIFNPLKEVRDQTHILMDISQVHNPWASMGTPICLVFFNQSCNQLFYPKCTSQREICCAINWLQYLHHVPLP